MALLAGTALGCVNGPPRVQSRSGGRLTARPSPPADRVSPGEHALGLDEARDGVLFVPRGYDASRAAPLVVMLHGAGGRGRGMAFTFEHAQASGAIVLAPDSRHERTWDGVLGRLGPDVEFLDRALAQTFRRCAVDAARIAVGGFSDGASYALALGLGNGDLFRDILAFSPGFIPDTPRRGSPRVFVSHGTRDTVLPIAGTSRRIVPALRDGGYDVTYREFEGGHTVPPAMATAAFGRFRSASG